MKAVEDSLVDDDKNASETLKPEFLAYEASMLQARLAPPPPGDRVVLISATKQLQNYGALNRIWLEEQAKWAKAIGAQQIVIDATHQIQRSNPEVVVNAVKSLLNLLNR